MVDLFTPCMEGTNSFTCITMSVTMTSLAVFIDLMF